ncbi:unnamed protein product [Auanema sp. JU1783]|nr:unnamed protein product [Auanema sp. JU1783]
MTRLAPLSLLLVLCCLSGFAVQNTEAYYYYYPTSYYYYPYTYSSYYGYYYPYYSYYGKREVNWNDSPDMQRKSQNAQAPPMYGQQGAQPMPAQSYNGQQNQQAQDPQYNIMPTYRNQN